MYFSDVKGVGSAFSRLFLELLFIKLIYKYGFLLGISRSGSDDFYKCNYYYYERLDSMDINLK